MRCLVPVLQGSAMLFHTVQTSISSHIAAADMSAACCLPCRPDRLVRACAELPKLCEFFHIPFQSGDDDILRGMARGYTAGRYKSIIDNIRRYMPDASISGDAIVGFPGKGGLP